jgi:hypothetical protein
MGAVVKGSDKLKAEVLAGVKVNDQRSMNLANEILQSKGLPEKKARMSTQLLESTQLYRRSHFGIQGHKML